MPIRLAFRTLSLLGCNGIGIMVVKRIRSETLLGLDLLVSFVNSSRMFVEAVFNFVNGFSYMYCL